MWRAEKRHVWKTRNVKHTYFFIDPEAHALAQGGGRGIGSGQMAALRGPFWGVGFRAHEVAENMGGFAVPFLCHWSGELAISLLSSKLGQRHGPTVPSNTAA